MIQELSAYPVIHEQTVAWGEMDMFGHVNNVWYYRYIESARISYCNKVELLEEDIFIVVAASECTYLAPVFYPDHLKVAARVEKLGNSSITMTYLVWSEQQEKLVATGKAVLVTVDKVSLQKKTITDALRQKIIHLEKSVEHELG